MTDDAVTSASPPSGDELDFKKISEQMRELQAEKTAMEIDFIKTVMKFGIIKVMPASKYLQNEWVLFVPEHLYEHIRKTKG